MSEDTAKLGTDAGRPETGCCEDQMSMRSMPKRCMGMMGKRFPILLIVLFGVLLIALGALIVIEPRVLVWLLATAAVLMGAMLLTMAGFIRKMGARQRG
jgi:hypothetical protein